MAEIQQDSGGNKKGKNHQKKMQIRVDFTPMVDMNMLLITFFMLCTTMIKSQTLPIALPSNEKPENLEQQNQASENDAVTIIIDAKRKPGTNTVDSLNGNVVNEVYYYFGKPGGDAGIAGPGGAILSENNNLEKSSFLTDEVNGDGTKTGGIRKIIQKRNQEVLKQISKLKEDYRNGKFGPLDTKEQKEEAMVKYNEAASKVKSNKDIKKPVMIIKSTPEASYRGLVDILDEMQINSISIYQIDNMTHEDSLMLTDYRTRHNE